MRVAFNESKHIYTLGDKPLISVTQLLKKHGLSTDYTSVNAEVLERSAGKGTTVHKEIEEYIKNGNVGFTSELVDFIDIANELLLVVSGSEVVLPAGDIPESDADKHILAGTADIIGTSKDGLTLADIKTTAKVDKRACAWQLSLYERLYGKRFDKFYILHLGKDSKAIPIDRIPESEVDRLLECERNGEIYREKGLDIAKEIIECAQAAELELARAEQEKKAAESVAKEYRAQLYSLMEEQNIASWETADKAMKITRVAPTQKTSIDSKRLTEELPEIAQKYSTVSTVKGYVKITVRGA